MPDDPGVRRLVAGDGGSSIQRPPPAAGPADPGALAPSPVAVLTDAGQRGPLSGRQWQDFQIGDLIATGGMGEVYLALQQPMERVVALKVLPEGATVESLVRFASEARAAAQINHPHVVAVHACGERDGRAFMAMEYAEGGSLADLIARQRVGGTRFTPFEAADLVWQAASGLAAAHAAGLVHRDLKPANLLLTADGAVKVGDFGLVRFLDGHARTIAGTVLGTPLYMAPEQGRGLPASQAADIYSLGCVLYELLTLQPPFTGDTCESLVMQHNFSEPPLPAELNPEVPADLQAVCLTCLQKDPAARYVDAAALGADLERVRAGQAVLSAVFPPGRISTGADAALSRLGGHRRRWTTVMVAIAAALALALGLGWWWWDARKVETLALRERLAPLARAVAIPATSAGDLERLARLAGVEDPQVAQGRIKLARVGSLVATLERLSAEQALGQAALGEARSALAGLVEEVGEAGDPRLGRWSAQLADAAAVVERLRARLAPLINQRGDLTSDVRARIASDLSLFLATAPETDRDRQAWTAKLAQFDAKCRELRQHLVRLDDPAPLSLDEMQRLKPAALEYGMISSVDAASQVWIDRVSTERHALQVRITRLVDLLRQPVLTPGERQDLIDQQAWLVARGVKDQVRDERVRDRLAASAAELAALRGRLAALDAPRTLPQGVGESLDRFEALAGFADADGLRWRRRFEAVRALQARLAPLDRPEPVPPAAADDLLQLTGLVGATDPQVAAWSAKLEAVRVGKVRLGVALDRPQPVPPDAAGELARMVAAIGSADADIQRWSHKLAAVARMAADESVWDGLVVLTDAALSEARAALAERRALIGDDEVTRRREARIAELLGPSPPAWAAEHGRDGHGPWITVRIGGAEQRLRWLPPIGFTMGSPPDEAGHEADEAPVRVRLTRGCWIADSECSQAMWQAVMGRAPGRQQGADLPVSEVSAVEADGFCVRLAGLLAGCRPRLPSEAEWEAAARAGSAGPWGGLDPERGGGIAVHDASGPRPVEDGTPNALGLRHVLGNVREWCGDAYGPQPSGDPALDPRRGEGVLRAVRGGSWGEGLTACRVANRHGLAPERTSPLIGFRWVCEP